MRLYTDFFQSDIIVASPLALATKLGEGPEEDGKHPQVWCVLVWVWVCGVVVGVYECVFGG